MYPDTVLPGMVASGRDKVGCYILAVIRLQPDRWLYPIWGIAGVSTGPASGGRCERPLKLELADQQALWLTDNLKRLVSADGAIRSLMQKL